MTVKEARMIERELRELEYSCYGERGKKHIANIREILRSVRVPISKDSPYQPSKNCLKKK